MQFLSEQFDNRTKFLALFLMWTLCLGMTTLSIQHSRNPLICAPSPDCRIVQRGGKKQLVEDGQAKGKITIQPPAKKKPLANQPTNSESGPSKPDSEFDQVHPLKCNKNLMPSVFAGVSGAAAGAGASTLASAGVISVAGGAVIALPATVAVSVGILVFLALKSFSGGDC